MLRSILIVDDIKANREILKNILGSEYSFLEAENGKEAMTIMLRSYKYLSAVLLDLSMPVMDGFQVLRQVSNNPVLSLIPVIVMTGSTEAELEVKALMSGACDYIVKPYNAVIIRQRVHNMIKLRETSATVNALQKDRLTGLLSREAYFERISSAIALQRPGYYTLSCVNIDNFKVINDQYGSDVGDTVLLHLAENISRFSS